MYMKKISENLQKSLTTVVDSHLNTHYRIGMRVVKTTVSVMICLLIALLTGGWDYMSITAVSAIVTIRPTRGETLNTGIFRVLGTFFGGLLGILTVIIGLYLPFYKDGLFVLVIPLMLLLNLYLCNVLKMQDSCTISCVVTILVAAHVNLDATLGGALVYTLFRIRDTLIGVVVATVLNLIPFRAPAELQTENGESAQSDAVPGDAPGDTPGDTPEDASGDTPGSKPADVSDDRQGDVLNLKPGDTPGSKPADVSDDRQGDALNLKPGVSPGEK